MTALNRIAIALPFAVFLGIYATSVGHGFVADDFGWILDSKVGGLSEAPSLFQKSSGFYRPVVGLTFAADYAIFGNQPLGYGLTNLALALGCAALLYLLARELALPAGAALFAVLIWLLNPHGINMAIVWMSGRTALMLTMGALAAALLVLRGRPFAALLPAALALFSKEEGVLLPAILFAWWVTFRPDDAARPGRRAAWAAAACALLALYLVLRSQTGAMTPWTAPPYYRFTANPRIVAKNVWEYADRALTFPLAATVLSLVLLRPDRRAPWFSPRVAVCGAAWIAGGYGLTMFLPVRSSLYACFPSVGACLIAADIAGRRWMASSEGSRRLVSGAAIVVALALIPVYHLRNRTTVANARFSSSVLRDLDAATRELPNGENVIVVDDRRRRPNIETAFNVALNDAFELVCGRRLNFWVEPPLQHAAIAGLMRPCASCVRAVLSVRDGRVVK